MKAILICPAERPAVAELGAQAPLVLAPMLGRTPLTCWVESLAARGIKEVLVLAADRPARLRDHVGDGRRWGVRVDIQPTAHELSIEEARARYARVEAASDAIDISLVDHLPGLPEFPLFESYAGWLAAQQAWIPHAVTPGRVGAHEQSPGVWVGLQAHIDPSVQLQAPCWIGDYARVEAGATIGPGAVVDDRCVIEEGARIVDSVVGPDTFVGKFVSLEQSLAFGSRLIHCRLNSSLRVPDDFLLADLSDRPEPTHRPTLGGRLAAGLTMAVSTPIALCVILLSLVRGEAPFTLQLGLRPQRAGRRVSPDTFGYYELTGAKTWLRRWPQFWSVMRGDMTWTGNRPLRPTQALLLANDFERLWLSAPVGLISLADAHGCPDGISDNAIAHASYYAVHANWRLNASIIARSVFLAAQVWPFRSPRRREVPVHLQNLAQRQEL